MLNYELIGENEVGYSLFTEGEVVVQVLDTVISDRKPDYQGPYEVTPSQQTQTLGTAGHELSQNITINPIPSNYGLITYNGAYLTVS